MASYFERLLAELGQRGGSQALRESCKESLAAVSAESFELKAGR